MNSHPSISVIIPTYNRKTWLRQSLESLAKQTLSTKYFEVIIIDDGSTDGTEEIASETFPFYLCYIRQENQGDAAARNTGVDQSQADIIVFLDDDILVSPEYLTHIMSEQTSIDNRIVIGTEYLWLKETNPMDQSQLFLNNEENEVIDILFTDVCSNNMSIRRQAYYNIGKMEALGFSGSSIWCDIDFSYRAYQQGFKFYRSTQAICWHRDYVAFNLDNKKKRWREVAYRAIRLFQKHPDLLPHFPMFDDKVPISLAEDSSRLIVRKFLRKLMSSQVALAGLEQFARLVGNNDPDSSLASLLDRWIIGGYIYRGYQDGLRDFLLQPGLKHD